MRRLQSKSPAVLILLLLAGVVLGGFIGDWLGASESFRWLAYGKSFGITSPFTLDLGIIVFQFVLSIRLTIAGLLGFFIAALIYKFI